MRCEQRLLVDVLQRAAPFEHGGGRSAEQHDRRLRERGVRQRRQDVGDAGTGRHGGDAGSARESCLGIGRKDSRRLVANIYYRESLLARGNENR